MIVDTGNPVLPENSVPPPTVDPEVTAHADWKKQQDERSWAMFCHISVFAAMIIPFGHIVGPLVVWLVKRAEYPLVDDQGRESLNYQISMTIYSVILLVVFAVGLIDMIAEGVGDFIPLTMILSGAALLLLGIINFILIIIASVRSYRGERYRYPLTINFVS